MNRAVKILSAVAVAALLNASFPGLGFADDLPVKQPAPVKKVFVPQGFDDNDNVEVIVHGHFPDSCMKIGPVEFDINPESRVISLRPEVYAYKSPYCLPVEVPFVQRVALGNLSEGAWKVEVKGFSEPSPLPLLIEKARSSAPDEALYAPVENVVLIAEPNGPFHRVVVSGRWPQVPAGKCFELVKVMSRLGRDNTLVVLPTAEMRNEGQCHNSGENQRSFVAGSVVESILAGDLLIHVRVLNGESLNKFQDL